MTHRNNILHTDNYPTNACLGAEAELDGTDGRGHRGGYGTRKLKRGSRKRTLPEQSRTQAWKAKKCCVRNGENNPVGSCTFENDEFDPVEYNRVF